jgi:hypothetical protein
MVFPNNNFSESIRRLKLMHFKPTFFHGLMTFKSKVNDFLEFWDREIWFKTLGFYFINLTWPPRSLKKKRTKTFTGGGCGASMIIPHPFLSGSKKLSIRAYFFCVRISSFRILKKTGDFFCSSLFLFLLPRKSDRKLAQFFR